jgi:hypothetical protein
MTVAMSAIADTGIYQSLTFIKTDGSKISYSADGLKITYDDFAHAVIENNETIDTLDLAGIVSMYFSNDNANSLKGDVNGDGEINIADINAIINIILSSNCEEDIENRADVNGDGEINIADVNAIIDIILSS